MRLHCVYNKLPPKTILYFFFSLSFASCVISCTSSLHPHVYYEYKFCGKKKRCDLHHIVDAAAATLYRRVRCDGARNHFAVISMLNFIVCLVRCEEREAQTITFIFVRGAKCFCIFTYANFIYAT